MKKVLLSLVIIATLTSCESKLPANINSAVEYVKLIDGAHYEDDSLFSNLTKAQIDKLDVDSLRYLKIVYSTMTEDKERASKELKELLKYNPEYSDHSKVKDKDSEGYKRGVEEYRGYLNYAYIRDLYFYREFATGEKPIYEN